MRVFRILPSWTPMRAITLFQRVFAQKDVSDVTLRHEEIHVQQQKRDGWRFYARYVFSAKWRVKYEAEAFVEEFVSGYSIDLLATFLSGPLYLRPCTWEEAREAIMQAAHSRKVA